MGAWQQRSQAGPHRRCDEISGAWFAAVSIRAHQFSIAYSYSSVVCTDFHLRESGDRLRAFSTALATLLLAAESFIWAQTE